MKELTHQVAPNVLEPQHSRERTEEHDQPFEDPNDQLLEKSPSISNTRMSRKPSKQENPSGFISKSSSAVPSELARPGSRKQLQVESPKQKLASKAAIA